MKIPLTPENIIFATRLHPFSHIFALVKDKNKIVKYMETMKFLKPMVSLLMLGGGIAMDALGTGWFSGDVVRLAWYVVAFLPVGLGVMREAWECATEKEVFSEFMLMSVASVGAFIIGEYPEAVAVMLFYCIGETLQDMAVDRARDNIKSLMEFRPDHASLVCGGTVKTVKPDDVKPGDVIEVKPGERVPLDGELTGNEAEFNTAALTGESVPRMIETGGEVLAGMIAVDSVVRLKVTRKAGDSAVARILSMVEEASSRKAPAELFIRKFARVYTPVVTCLAVLTIILPLLWSLVSPSFTYVFSDWFYRALIFLVISCPCALVISVPLSYFSGIGAASTRGILFKGGNYIDAMTHVDTVVFDKTGTLTRGVFSVVKVDGGNTDEMINVVAAMERGSNHPIAKAIVSHAKGGNAEVNNVKDVAGYGMTATCGKDSWVAGTLRMLDREHISYPEELARVPETIVACAKNGQYVGCILLADTLKDDAAEAVKNLRKAGVKHIEILSGDKQALVDKVSAELRVDRGNGDLLPQGKLERIETLKREGHNVAFTGDGINDAPVLALSNVGIAMGGLGADMAIETADVVIQNDRPSMVAEAIRISRRTRGVVRQNIVFAIGVKVLVMALGLAGIANLWGAVFADVGVALLAVLNATRIFMRIKN